MGVSGTKVRAALSHKTFGGIPSVVIALAVVATAAVIARQVGSNHGSLSPAGDTSLMSASTGGLTTTPGPLPTMTPTGPAWIVRPATPSSTSTSTTASPGTSPAGTTPGSPTTTTAGSSGTSPQLTTTTDYPRFNCTATVTLFAGERTGDLRRVKVAVDLSTNEVPSVWVETRWDDNAEVNAVRLNPTGSIEFLVYAPGDDWPTARVFAASDLRASSQMCGS